MVTGAPPTVQRQVVAVVAAVVAAVVGANIFGEYDLSGITPFLGGVLFGLAIAEVVLTVARAANPVLAGSAAVCSGGGVYWAASISSGIAPVPGRGYVAAVIAAAVSAGWVLASAGRRGRGSPRADRPAPTEKGET